MQLRVESPATDSGWASSERQLWARRAALYNKLGRATQSGFLNDFLDHCPLPPQADVLDTGIGTAVVGSAKWDPDWIKNSEAYYCAAGSR